MYLITGGNGQLGTELRYLFDEQGIEYISTDAKEMDITNKEDIDSVFRRFKPNIVFHCAAYTAVDKAEAEGKELDEKINIDGSRNVAEAAKKIGATLIYISTDYVFDGTKDDGQYNVNDKVNPQNEYGRTKLAGEKIIQETLDKYYIIRTSWVFGEFGKNFVYTMLNLAESNKVLTVVNDQFGRPTWTRTLSEFMNYIIEQKAPFGIYHLSNENSCSWYEFAREILKNSSVEIKAVSSSEYPQKAKRPQYSIMDLSKAKATGFEIPTWQDALSRMLDSKNKH